MTAADHLKNIFDADRAMRRAEQALLKVPHEPLADLLSTAVRDAKALESEDEPEAMMRLPRLADLCAQVPGPEMADALIAILDSEIPAIRVAAAEALVDVAFDRYAEVARAVDRVLERGHQGPAMGELPWVIAEIAEPSAVPLIGRFLKLEDAAIVASATEALATLGDPDAIPLLEPFLDDKRAVELGDGEDDDGVSATLGELVSEVIYNLSRAQDAEHASAMMEEN